MSKKSSDGPNSRDEEPQFDREWEEIVAAMPELDKVTPKQLPLSDDDPQEASSRNDYQVSASPSGPRDWLAADVEEHFDAPDPGPLRVRNPWLSLGWIVVIVSVLALLGLLIFWRNPPLWIGIVLAVALFGGITLLFVAMPNRRPSDLDSDDGAQV